MKSLDEALLEIRDSGDPSYEVIGQCFDVVVQAVEHFHSEQYEVGMPSFRLSEIGRWLDGEVAEDVVEAYHGWLAQGKLAISDLHPSKQVADAFVGSTVAWLRSTEWTLPEYRSRIRYVPKEINQTGFEWAGRYRYFSLMQGSVTRTKADVLVVSAEIAANGAWSGQVLHLLERQLNLGPVIRRLFSGDDVEVVVRIPQHDQTPFERVLVLGVPAESDVFHSEGYAGLIKAMLSALRAEETWSDGVKTVSCAFLGGNRLNDVAVAATPMVEAARQWLKNSEAGETFKLVLFNSLSDKHGFKEVAKPFSLEMDRVLGRSAQRIKEHPVLEPLRLELLESLGGLSEAMRKPAEPLMDALMSEEGLTIELVCTFARAWVEQLAVRLQQKAGFKPSGELLRSIEKLRESGTISPWVASYMHTCRIMGNKSIHPPKSPPSYSPDRLLSADLATTMASVHALAAYAHGQKL